MPESWRTCHGWAYEECEQPARFVMREEEIGDRYWSVTGVCLKHAVTIMRAVGYETADYIRTWVPVEHYTGWWHA